MLSFFINSPANYSGNGSFFAVLASSSSLALSGVAPRASATSVSGYVKTAPTDEDAVDSEPGLGFYGSFSFLAAELRGGPFGPLVIDFAGEVEIPGGVTISPVRRALRCRAS